MFVSIAGRFVNRNLLLGIEGVNQKSGKIILHVDPRLGFLVGVSQSLTYRASSYPMNPAIIELTGEEALEFRKQWGNTSTMSAGG